MWGDFNRPRRSLNDLDTSTAIDLNGPVSWLALEEKAKALDNGDRAHYPWNKWVKIAMTECNISNEDATEFLHDSQEWLYGSISLVWAYWHCHIGQRVVDRSAFKCCFCQEWSEPWHVWKHQGRTEKFVSKGDITISCPLCENKILLDCLVPDFTMAGLAPEKKVEYSDLKVKEIGRGGFAVYCDINVAIKLYVRWEVFRQ